MVRTRLKTMVWTRPMTMVWTRPKTMFWARPKTMVWTWHKTMVWTRYKTMLWTWYKTMVRTRPKTMLWTRPKTMLWTRPKTMVRTRPKTMVWNRPNPPNVRLDLFPVIASIVRTPDWRASREPCKLGCRISYAACRWLRPPYWTPLVWPAARYQPPWSPATQEFIYQCPQIVVPPDCCAPRFVVPPDWCAPRMHNKLTMIFCNVMPLWTTLCEWT